MKWLATLLLCWTVIGRPVYTVDGDTFDLVLSIWMNQTNRERVRLIDGDTYLNTPERGKPGFQVAKDFTAEWLSRGDVTVFACKRDAFGRVLGMVSRDGVYLSKELISHKFGVKSNRVQ